MSDLLAAEEAAYCVNITGGGYAQVSEGAISAAVHLLKWDEQLVTTTIHTIINSNTGLCHGTINSMMNCK